MILNTSEDNYEMRYPSMSGPTVTYKAENYNEMVSFSNKQSKPFFCFFYRDKWTDNDVLSVVLSSIKHEKLLLVPGSNHVKLTRMHRMRVMSTFDEELTTQSVMEFFKVNLTRYSFIV